MYIDWTYIIIVLPFVLFAAIASANVSSTYKRYSKKLSLAGKTGYDVARMILDENNLQHIRIEITSGHLSDHYDPRANVVRLSADVYHGTSMASIGVAAHECGHAVQHANNYIPVKIRSAIIPATNFGAKISIPLIVLGIILTLFAENFIYLAYAGVICFGLTAIFQLVTLPVEFNASNRALKILKNCGHFSDDEVRCSKKVLNAAAMTYVAALAVTLAQLLRLALIVMQNDRDR
ncbi:MAG: zinc metallopeptidase [Clostridia bacterium]|nr:zinc metallopeptidase [Clostridia bacterium]